MSEATEATTKVKKERTPAQIEALSRARQLANQKRKENAELRLKEREIKKAELESRRTQIEKDYETKVKNKQAEVVEIEDQEDQESEPEPEQQVIQKVKKVKSKKKKRNSETPSDLSFSFPVNKNTFEIKVDYTTDMTISSTENIDEYTVYINEDFYGTDLQQIQVNTNDIIRINVIKKDNTQQSLIVVQQKLI